MSGKGVADHSQYMGPENTHTGEPITERKTAWLVRRLRFSPDGQTLAVATWTPANPMNDGRSKPSLLLFPLVFGEDIQRSEPKTASR